MNILISIYKDLLLIFSRIVFVIVLVLTLNGKSHLFED